jgi:DeoR/GlpR family transcriptional regulator of sugar metabolism
VIGVLPVDRRHRILERVSEQQSIHIGELAQEFGVSEMTIRRDVARLERDGFLRRTYGGATAHVTRSLELAFNARALQQTGPKRLIGMAAAELVRDAATMFVGIGTTTEQFAQFLPGRRDLTVITGSVPIASLLGTRSPRVVILGGTVRRDELSCIGPVAAATVRRYHADVAVLGAAGLTVRHGVTELNDDEAEIQRLMVEHSDTLVIIADGTKLGFTAPVQVTEAERIDTLVTDEGAPPEEVSALQAVGVHVSIARRPSTGQPPAEPAAALDGHLPATDRSAR